LLLLLGCIEACSAQMWVIAIDVILSLSVFCLCVCLSWR